MQKTKHIRWFIFLKDVFVIATTCFGGPQIHLVAFINKFVKERKYLSEAELMELRALCEFLPGPTSTQTITAIGFKIGKAKLAYLTLLVWITPSVFFMTLAALGVSYLDPKLLISLSKFIKPMGIAFIFYAAFAIGKVVINTKTAILLLILATIAAYFFRSPYVTPIWIILGGLTTAFKYKKQEKLEKDPLKIQWGNFFLWFGVFMFSVALGTYTKLLPIRLFENFYRNGSLTFGGGHVLKPLLYNEFVAFKHYLSADEFLSGISISEIIPGPTFAISSYVGALSMRDYGVSGQIVGSVLSGLGIFLPGIFLIFFAIRFWSQLKQYRGIRASLEGVNAATTGLTLAAGISLFETQTLNLTVISTFLITFLLLFSQKVPSYLIILGGLFLGYIFK